MHLIKEDDDNDKQEWGRHFRAGWQTAEMVLRLAVQ